MIRGALGSRYGISGALGRSVKRESAATSWWLAGGIAAANCIGAYQAKGVADIGTSYVNLANPGTYNLTNGDAPTFDTTYGWYFGGSDWLKTGVIPANNNTWSAIVRLSEISRATRKKSAFGVYSTGYTNKFSIDAVGGSVGTSGFSNGSFKQITTSVTSGVFAVTPTGIFIDGVKTANTFTSNGNLFAQIYIGAQNELSTASAKYIGKMQAVAFYDIDISDYVAGLTTAMNAL